MSEKTLKTRIIHKHDTEQHWNLAENFIPKQGELIVYDIDDTHTYERFKIGDGKTLVSELPFANVTYSEATTTTAGLMSAADKEKLDDNVVTLDSEQTISGKKTFSGEVDFTDATVTGLSSGGASDGTLSIEVEELPTENIDDSKIYILNDNIEVYIKAGTAIYTLAEYLAELGVESNIHYYIVEELPEVGEVTNLETMSSIYCYIDKNGISNVYGNAGAGNMWLTAGTLFLQKTGATIEDKGRTENIYSETDLMGIYTYWETKFYLYSNDQWKKDGNGIGFNPNNDYTWTGSNEFKGATHLMNSVFIGDVDHGEKGSVGFYTETVTFQNGTVTFNNGANGDTGKVEFKGSVDFSNATITGLPTCDIATESAAGLIKSTASAVTDGTQFPVTVDSDGKAYITLPVYNGEI